MTMCLFGEQRRIGDADDNSPFGDPCSGREEDLVTGVEVVKCSAEGDAWVQATVRRLVSRRRCVLFSFI
jgi:hypothetical protein